MENTSSAYSEIGHAVPLEERLCLPDNEPAPSQDTLLREIPQKPYDSGLKRNKPADSISYFPGGFTVATVLAGDLSEVVNPDEEIPTLPGQFWPDKTAFHLEFSDPAYDSAVHTKQRRAPKTRGAFATLAAEEIKKILAELPQFPYALDQIKVVSIDVCSRGTVQARLFVSAEVLALSQASA